MPAEVIPLHQQNDPIKYTNVIGGKCTFCQEDLSDLLHQVRRGQADMPKCCRRCGLKLQQPIKVPVWICGHCNTELTLESHDPKREKYCTKCGKKLVYPTDTTDTDVTEHQ